MSGPDGAAQSGEAPPSVEHPAVLMLGKGWFPDTVGGLDRYFRCLLEHQPEAHGVVIGPVSGACERVDAASDNDAPLAWRLVAFSLAARRRATGAAVLNAHFALYALLPLLSRRVRALPTVVHFHGPWADENVAQGDSSALRRSLRRALERVVYRRAARVVVLSSAFRRVVIERYGVSPWRVAVEPPGVDLERFAPGYRDVARARLGLAEDAFVVLCVRRLVPRMGLDVLLDAWRRALVQLPAGAQLLVVGSGPLAAELDAQIEREELNDSVRLMGRVDDGGLVHLFRAADVGVVPTRSFEGFGLVVIEAAACGTPTIVTRVGGLPEAVRRLDPSLVVPPGDAAALATRIVRASGAGGLPSRSATRAFAETHAWSAVADRVRAVEREVLEPAPAARRLRVVYLDHVAQLSGGEIGLLRLLPHLSNVESHVILAEDGPFADALAAAGVSAEVLPLAERVRGLRKARVSARLPLAVIPGAVIYVLRLALRLRRLRPDVVHTNSLKAGVYGSIAGRLAGVPVVWHVRDRIAPDYLSGPAVRAIRALTRRLPSAVIANSQATMDTLGPHGTPATAAVIPDTVVGPPPGDRDPASSFSVGLVGRIAPWKGQELFLRAFADAFPDGDARCVLVGAPLFGEDAYEGGLHALAHELGLGSRVEFRGFRTDIWPELDRLDLLVHASLIPEPFGQVILEGMAAGLPVLAAAAGGPAELISDDVDGVLYPIGDQRALAAAMRTLAGDAQLRQRLVHGGLVTAAAHHPGVMAERVESLYEAVTR